MTERDLFLTALEIEDPADRAAFLEKECGADDKLKRRVEALLRSHDGAEGFLDGQAGTVELTPITEKPGTVIGRYKLMEQIGEGGMGVVYVAHQEQPVRRKLALKIIKPGMDTAEVIARFEAERQALALMDHPNIAKVLDAGATETGRPYFVMELVKGVPITEYCDQNNLATGQRLELFVAVCQAVQHAHQKGIIHRDIKPSNVLVTLHDSTPVVKVIDFGIAKAINQELTERTIYTRFAQMVGTPPYMSPEQAQLSGLDVDTRSDVYSLGVLLYELLTGTTPFEKERLNAAAYEEIRRIIREEEPPKPSTKISTLGDSATAVSNHRRTDPKGLFSLVRGDLDWIVMRALEKDRTRRYETAKDFADDVVRHGSDQPIEARPPSTGYRVRKFVRRNKGLVAGVTSVFLLLVVALTTISLALVTVRHERQRVKMAYEMAEVANQQLEDKNAEIEETAGDLRKALSELQSTTKKLRESLKDMALAAAMGGQRGRAEELIANAREAGAAESWREMMLGILCLYTGKSNEVHEAVLHLERAVQLDEDNVAARAMLFSALMRAGGKDWIAHELELQKRQPTSALDHLFLAFARAFINRQEGLRFADKAIEMRDLPIARTVRAELLGWHILDTRDTTLVQQALDDVETARVLLRDNPYVLRSALWVHHVVMKVQPERDQELRARADEIATELARFSDNPDARWARAEYFADTDRIDEARLECLAAIDTGGTGHSRMHSVIFLYGLGELEKLEALYNPKNDWDRVWSLKVQAEKPSGYEAALRKCREYATSQEPELVTSALGTLLFLGDTEFARKTAQDQLGMFHGNWKHKIESIADVPADDGFETLSKDSRFWFALWHHDMGEKYLSEGDRKNAKKHFQKCVDTRVFGLANYYWSQAYLRRMETDPTWPHWIPADITAN